LVRLKDYAQRNDARMPMTDLFWRGVAMSLSTVGSIGLNCRNGFSSYFGTLSKKMKVSMLAPTLTLFGVIGFGIMQQTVIYRRFRRSTKRRGIFFQSIFTAGDLLQAFGLTFESSALRSMVVVAAAATYATRGLAWGEHKQGRELRALACTFLATNYSLYYFFWVVETPVLRFHRTFWNVSIMEKARLLRRPFWPLFWMTNRHLQTVVGSIAGDLYWMFRKPVTYDRQEVTAFDGSSLQLDWYANNDAFADPDQPYGDGLTNLSFMAQSSHFVRQSMRRVATTLKLRAPSMDSKSAQDMATLLTAGVAMDSFNGGKV